MSEIIAIAFGVIWFAGIALIRYLTIRFDLTEYFPDDFFLYASWPVLLIGCVIALPFWAIWAGVTLMAKAHRKAAGNE